MLGKKVKDTITGITGIAVARIEYMNGCIQYQIQTKVIKDGIPAEAQWFDIQRVVLVPKAKSAVKGKQAGTGGPPPASTPHLGK